MEEIEQKDDFDFPENKIVKLPAISPISDEMWKTVSHRSRIIKVDTIAQLEDMSVISC